MIRNPRILLLDEATAALDYQSERDIQRAIEQASSSKSIFFFVSFVIDENTDRTTIIIAHRLSTIRHADQIIVLHQGKIVEIGTHQSLIDQRGKYYELLQGKILENKFDEDLPDKEVHLGSVVTHINEEKTKVKSLTQIRLRMKSQLFRITMMKRKSEENFPFGDYFL